MRNLQRSDKTDTLVNSRNNGNAIPCNGLENEKIAVGNLEGDLSRRIVLGIKLIHINFHQVQGHVFCRVSEN